MEYQSRCYRYFTKSGVFPRDLCQKVGKYYQRFLDFLHLLTKSLNENFSFCSLCLFTVTRSWNKKLFTHQEHAYVNTFIYFMYVFQEVKVIPPHVFLLTIKMYLINLKLLPPETLQFFLHQMLFSFLYFFFLAKD